MRRLILICVAALSVSVPLMAADAAAPVKPKLFLIHEELARPSMLREYESTTTELLTALTEKKADPKVFGMNLYMTPEFHYIYVMPMSNWATLDSFWPAFQAMGESIGKEKWANLMRRANSAMESYNELVVMERPDLSYQPETPRLKPEEQRFVHWAFYYLDAARAGEAEQIAKDYAALFRAKKTGDGFMAYMAMSGQDLPLLIIAVPAKSAADYYGNDEKLMTSLATEIQPLAARALAITRRYRTMDGYYRPDLSYPMMTASK